MDSTATDVNSSGIQNVIVFIEKNTILHVQTQRFDAEPNPFHPILIILFYLKKP